MNLLMKDAASSLGLCKKTGVDQDVDNKVKPSTT
jgi:hypothetical protein